jgi:NhaP-type Na+/H+ or K+/H+ antiporter
VDSWSLAIAAGTVLGYAALSRRLERTVITAPIVFVTVGLLTGNEVLGWLDLGIGSSAVRALAEATLTLVLFADASRIDLAKLRREIALPVRLLGIGLPLTIAAGTAVAAATFGQLTWPEALVLSIVLAPTDAALGQAVVTDPRVPMRIRQALNVESGLNDGICVPLLFIALAIAEADENAITVHHAVMLVLEEIGFGVVGGVVAGAAAAQILAFARRRALVDEAWEQVIPLAAAGLSYGIAAPLGGSGFIAAFVAGLVFGVLSRARGGEVTYLVEAGGGVLNAVTLIAFGAVALGPALGDVDLRIVLYAVLSLTAVRMLPVALSLMGMHARRPTTAFVGWFGPRGLASIVFGVIVLEGSVLEHRDLIITVVIVTVGLSVYAHGVTAVPLAGAYARWYAGHREPPRMESAAVHEHRVRRADLGAPARARPGP